MKANNKKIIAENLEKIRSVHDQLQKIYQEEHSAFYTKPESVRESDWGWEEEEQIQKLESAIDELDDAIGYLEDISGHTDSGTSRITEQETPEESFEEPQLGFFSKLLMGLMGAETLKAVKQNLAFREQEYEQARKDMLFWQDETRKNDPTYSDFVDGVDNDWDH